MVPMPVPWWQGGFWDLFFISGIFRKIDFSNAKYLVRPV